MLMLPCLPYFIGPCLPSPPSYQAPFPLQTRQCICALKLDGLFSFLLLCLMNRLLMTSSRISLERKNKCIFRPLKGKRPQRHIFSTSNPLLVELRFAESYVFLGSLIFFHSEALQFSPCLDHILGNIWSRGSRIVSKTISCLQNFFFFLINLVLIYTSAFHFLCFNM